MLRAIVSKKRIVNNKLLKLVKSKFSKIAEDLVKNPQALKFKVEAAKEKLNKESVIEALGSSIEEFKLFCRLILAWTSRKYTNVPLQTIIYITLSLVYFITPTDFVPDFILGLGFIDDIAVLKWVMDKIQVDLNNFRNWEDK